MDHSKHPSPAVDKKLYLFDKPENIKRLLHALYAICGLLVVLDFVIHRHILIDYEKIPAFYAIYGFVGCVVLVVVAKWMRTFLMRPEDYYTKEELKGDDPVSKAEEQKGGEH